MCEGMPSSNHCPHAVCVRLGCLSVEHVEDVGGLEGVDPEFDVFFTYWDGEAVVLEEWFGLDGVVDDRGVLLDVEDFEGCDAGSEVVR